MIKHVDREIEEYKKLTGQKKHYCPDWDFMAIDENSPEFEACTCYEKAFEGAFVEVSFEDGKRKVRAHLHNGELTPDEMDGVEFMQVIGGGWYGFRK